MRKIADAFCTSSPQAGLNTSTPKYTGCIVTLIWVDGIPRTRPVLFTSDPKFRDVNLHTASQKATYRQYQELLKHFRVSPEQIIYLPESSYYVGESEKLLREFFSIAKVPPNSVIFSDQGNAFFSGGEHLIPKLCGARTATYPPLIHHYLSPNDNHYHGVCKAKWRAAQVENGWGERHSLESNIFLLHCLNTVPEHIVATYFTQNFCLCRKCITVDRCLPLVSDGMIRRLSKRVDISRAERAYTKFLRGKDREAPVPPPPKLRSTLDRTYWESS